MIRRHLADILSMTLLLAMAIPYGVFWLVFIEQHTTRWISIPALIAPAAVMAVVAAFSSRAITNRVEDRARVRRDFNSTGQGTES